MGNIAQIVNRKFIFFLLTLLMAGALHAGKLFAGEATLTSDTMRYSPEEQRITALGNVRFSRAEGEILGDMGIGTVDGRQFEMHGNVRGTFTETSADIKCDSIMLGEEDSGRNFITATGSVVLTQGSDILNADQVTWYPGTPNYSASGSVIGHLGRHYLDADEAGRSGNSFSAGGVRRYEDRERSLILSATEVDGIFDGDDISELTATGQLNVTVPDEAGNMTIIHGNKGLYSVARGTLVITGNVSVLQQGRALQAGDIVYHLDTRRVEALGRPTLIIQQD